MISIRNIFLLLLSGFLFSACATIDKDYPREYSEVLQDTRDTRLGKDIAAQVEERPSNESGFYPLVDGIESLAARLTLIQAAEKSIDLQYYLIKSDITGKALLMALLNAADRGVRVRFLLDDVFTSGYDAGLAGLDSHPNFEMRIFNPFYRGFAGRARSGLTNLGTINRRMHNKSFTVDNSITIVGGRNLADEYFGARKDAKFGDLDVIGIGPVVDDVSTMFDTYWNHETALPLPAFLDMPEDPAAELERLRTLLTESTNEILDSPYAEAVKLTIERFIDSDAGEFVWAPYSLVYDSPDKGIKKRAAEAESITTPLIDSLRSAEKQMLVVSPYFVPLKSGVEAFNAVQARGVDVIIVTNSLAANNQFAVHGGYAPSRKPLLKGGVTIYEVRPDAKVRGSELVAASGAKSTLHTKAFIVDDREVFIGSFNFDPRSANLNTESGVIIESPELAREFLEGINQVLDRQAYFVYLDEQGRLRWKETNGDEITIHTKEPETSWWERFKAGFVRILPIRSQL